MRHIVMVWWRQPATVSLLHACFSLLHSNCLFPGTETTGAWGVLFTGACGKCPAWAFSVGAYFLSRFFDFCLMGVLVITSLVEMRKRREEVQKTRRAAVAKFAAAASIGTGAVPPAPSGGVVASTVLPSSPPMGPVTATEGVAAAVPGGPSGAPHSTSFVGGNGNAFANAGGGPVDERAGDTSQGITVATNAAPLNIAAAPPATFLVDDQQNGSTYPPAHLMHLVSYRGGDNESLSPALQHASAIAGEPVSMDRPEVAGAALPIQFFHSSVHAQPDPNPQVSFNGCQRPELSVFQ